MKILLILMTLISKSAFSRLQFEDATSPELLTSARALAMGNSYASLVDDSAAAFYNPAGLGTVRGFKLDLAHIHFELNNDFLDITGGSGNFFEAIEKYDDAFTSGGVRSLLADNPGNSTHARLNLFPNVTFRWLTFGYLYSQQQKARLESQTADFEIAERQDSGPVMAAAFSFFGGVVKLGATATHLTRKEIYRDTPQNQQVNISGDDYSRGQMTHIVASTRITFPVAFIPAISVVSRNLGSNQWYNVDLAGAPEEIPETMDIAFSITPFTGKGSRLHIEIGRKDISNQYEDVPDARKLQGGIEWNYRRKIFIRAGYGDGWGSGGFGIKGRSFTFDLSTYAVEQSLDGFREDEDRRYAINIASGF
jgi:hypothetical protein